MYIYSMMMKRLFDIAAHRAAEAPGAVMLAAKERGSWRTYTAKEVWSMAQSLAGGLQTLGLQQEVLEPEQQEKIAIIAPNRPEWMITDLGVQLTGAVLTPVYPTVSPQDLVYILNEAGVRIIFVANRELYDHFKDAFSRVSSLKHIYSFDPVPDIPSWTELTKKQLMPDASVTDRITEDTLATIIYTSGTTGNPKGVMLSHRNIVSNVMDCKPIFDFVHEGEHTISFLPLNHIFERMVTYVNMHVGLAIYYAESMDTIADNLKEVRPVAFITVPRLLEKVYEKIVAKGLELKGIKRALFFWSLRLGRQYDNVNRGSWWYRLQLAIANKLVFSKWREALGGRVKAIITGSAPCQERLLRTFTAAGITIMEGYGLTETSPVVSVNRFESEGRRIGTIGPVVDNVEVKIAGDGEILVRGNLVMTGYYKQPELTAEALKDGWLHTGDIGQWVEGRFLKITDRKKEIFKTSGGKYVAPQAIENKMKESPFVEQMVVIGNGRKFVSALIVPAFENMRKWLQEQGKTAPADHKALIAMPEVISQIQKQVDKYNPEFSHPEQVKKFVLLPAEWTIDSGELTPSLKVRRKVIEEKYAGYIGEIYGEDLSGN